MKKKYKSIAINISLMLIVCALVVIPLAMNKKSEFQGSDSKAENLIKKVNPKYKQWFSSIWEPPSGEIESFLFSLQTALGAGVMGYVIGFYRGKKKEKNV